MIKSLKNLFSTHTLDTKDENNEDLKILCGLMIEAANTDGNVTDEEVSKISSTLTNVFNENSIEVEQILKETIATKDEPKSLFFFTSKINKSFTEKKKLLHITSYLIFNIFNLCLRSLHHQGPSMLRRQVHKF